MHYKAILGVTQSSLCPAVRIPKTFLYVDTTVKVLGLFDFQEQRLLLVGKEFWVSGYSICDCPLLMSAESLYKIHTSKPLSV